MGDFVIRTVVINDIGLIGNFGYTTGFPTETLVSTNNVDDLLEAANYEIADRLKIILVNPTFTRDTIHSFRADFSEFDDIISLDGDTPIAFIDLPSGFTVTAAQLEIEFACTGGISSWDSAKIARELLLELNAVDQLDITGVADTYSGIGGLHATAYAYDFTGPDKPTMLDIINNGWGIQLTSGHNGLITPSGNGNSIYINNVKIVGTYEITSWDYDLDVDSPAIAGYTTGVINSPGGTLDTITSIIFQNSDGDTVTLLPADFLTWTPFTITFDFPTDVLGFVSVLLTGTEFSGSVQLGVLVVLIENGSGIYRLVKNKTNDTIYVNSGTGPTTTDVKIPDPYAKGGYIGG